MVVLMPHTLCCSEYGFETIKFDTMTKLDYVRKRRGLPFIKRGMKVELNYSGKTKTGVITGANESGNLNVRFGGNKHSDNCHPRWAVKYIDDKGNTLAEFPE